MLKLNETKIFDISTLSEYISVVENCKLTDCISRGKASKYGTLLAPAFRQFAKYATVQTVA